jgi:hypothetical protein
MKTHILFALLATGLAGSLASAHHSAAEYYGEKQKVTGTVKAWEWQNPHTFLQLMVPDGKGGEVEAGFEFGSPNTLIRNGFKATTFKAGDKATMVYTPRRDGRPGGAASVVYSHKDKKWLTWGPGADLAAAREAAAKRTGSSSSAKSK